ncbi:V-type ATP synthase subunit F [Arthrobacter sp. MA-N2]|uniref:V-type ATP synthase subunit F n=1 Tax=Arthrobacter sp. MA-N2 TaxID=1101188 RepID=UPI00055334AE|nr:V-type ATP synthase subunit F [Arthrobacter sp. MA-N2]
MSHTIAAIGEQALLDGFLLAGVSVFAGSTDEEFRHAWRALPEGTAVVVLTPAAARSLDQLLADPRSPMSVVLPS